MVDARGMTLEAHGLEVLHAGAVNGGDSSDSGSGITCIRSNRISRSKM